MHDLAGEIHCAPPFADCCHLLLCVLGCKTEWDEIRCWLRADVGQVVNVSCSEVFQHLSSKQGQQTKNCIELFCIKVMQSILAGEMWLF